VVTLCTTRFNIKKILRISHIRHNGFCVVPRKVANTVLYSINGLAFIPRASVY
jgi:hypothetical protein